MSLLGQGLLLGLTGFGGPVAHLAQFHRRFVEELRWLSAERYASLLALCQVLPGPASSQLVFLVGMERGGLAGGILIWLGFVLPTAVLLIAAGTVATAFTGLPLIGLKVAAAGVVLDACWSMARRFCTDGPSLAIATSTAVLVVLLAHPLVIPGTILLALLAGWRSADGSGTEAAPRSQPIPWWRVILGSGITALVLAASLLIPATAAGAPLKLLAAVGQGGALVFGGGHVVLPLLEGYVVPALMDRDLFLAGYGAAQAVPGPMFTLAAYLGTVVGGPLLGIAALTMIFLPGFALAWALLPVWDGRLASARWERRLHWVQATVVGLIAAALHQLVLPAALVSPLAALLVLLSMAALRLRVPVWLVVPAVGLLGGLAA